jgi:hypothetical protein
VRPLSSRWARRGRATRLEVPRAVRASLAVNGWASAQHLDREVNGPGEEHHLVGQAQQVTAAVQDRRGSGVEPEREEALGRGCGERRLRELVDQTVERGLESWLEVRAARVEDASAVEPQRGCDQCLDQVGVG